MNKTKQNFVKYLNKLSPPIDSDEWILAGKKRTALAANRKFGNALRKHDPIRFEVGYQEWCMK